MFGVDPNWKYASNELYFYNSLKMKMSIILGVTQMMLGIILSSFNAIHFRKPYNIFFEFIPQVVFMVSTFGYMVVLIFYKWLINWPGGDIPPTLCITNTTTDITNCNGPPSILNLMIFMFLSPLMTRTHGQFSLYPGQFYIQLILIFCILLSVPIMLFIKPLLLRRDHQKEEQSYQRLGTDETDADHGGEETDADHGGEHGEEFDFSEIFVHQIIHTIEFVLGAISNTASYLRLWALSLAHAELSEVFLQMILVQSFGFTSYIPMSVLFVLIWIAWSVWAAMTVAVLLGMESMSAFLHALRLHWVEFQNKFYMGDGYDFLPFSYEKLLKAES